MGHFKRNVLVFVVMLALVFGVIGVMPGSVHAGTCNHDLKLVKSGFNHGINGGEKYNPTQSCHYDQYQCKKCKQYVFKKKSHSLSGKEYVVGKAKNHQYCKNCSVCKYRVVVRTEKHKSSKWSYHDFGSYHSKFKKCTVCRSNYDQVYGGEKHTYVKGKCKYCGHKK